MNPRSEGHQHWRVWVLSVSLVTAKQNPTSQFWIWSFDRRFLWQPERQLFGTAGLPGARVS